MVGACCLPAWLPAWLPGQREHCFGPKLTQNLGLLVARFWFSGQQEGQARGRSAEGDVPTQAHPSGLHCDALHCIVCVEDDAASPFFAALLRDSEACYCINLWLNLVSSLCLLISASVSVCVPVCVCLSLCVC